MMPLSRNPASKRLSLLRRFFVSSFHVVCLCAAACAASRNSFSAWPRHVFDASRLAQHRTLDCVTRSLQRIDSDMILVKHARVPSANIRSRCSYDSRSSPCATFAYMHGLRDFLMPLSPLPLPVLHEIASLSLPLSEAHGLRAAACKQAAGRNSL